MQLVIRAIDPRLRDYQLADVLEELERLVPHPEVGALIFSGEPELILKKCLSEPSAMCRQRCRLKEIGMLACSIGTPENSSRRNAFPLGVMQ
jgi:hypothetical protein